ncbi:DUF5066 family protein [Xenorhabdus szentirmaii]|uniref:Uncharacterized protein n=1 Tax=Xenorhabdus szentirmaii DSM 16338 TaxID=1427518 RepID=W1ITB1_9GAMM|nr:MULTISPECIES: DUF5066 family protein [Xenorhabdus]MBD2805676.1 DUF5066 family protein [Xenorhabdus sp. ZM]PHM35125.1 hypothetical protein Xsze_01586 [Xenorhabdus szentirmaii DSM 16338]PHM43922.1 hypothetical protein Xszus_03740 [Xenorhabdus szentirmaii]CDL81732.1 conserved hypothetical protein [Xenorhabdus szentirmaii DSM 16338]
MENQFEIFMSAIKRENRNTQLNPMSDEELGCLRMEKYRHTERSETVALPKSLLALLAYDRDLTSPYGDKVFSHILSSIDEKNLIISDCPDDNVYFMVSEYNPDLDIEDLMPIWNDSPDLPAIFSIVHPGDQRIWIYTSELDESGEYPIARQEMEDFWLSESSLMEYLSNIFSITKEVDPKNIFQKKQAKYEERDIELLKKEVIHESFYEKVSDYD